MSDAMGYAFQAMSHDMQGKLSRYMTTLAPREAQPRYEQEVAEEVATAYHSHMKTQESSLEPAYNTKRVKIRDDHRARMEQFVRDKPPRYLEVGPDEPSDQSSAPPPSKHPRPPAKGRDRKRANAH